MTEKDDPDPRVDSLHQELATLKQKLIKLVSPTANDIVL